jgi:hypothetical protein
MYCACLSVRSRTPFRQVFIWVKVLSKIVVQKYETTFDASTFWRQRRHPSVLTCLTLILLMWRIWWAPNNASKWQMVFNSAFKGLMPFVREHQKFAGRNSGANKRTPDCFRINGWNWQLDSKGTAAGWIQKISHLFSLAVIPSLVSPSQYSLYSLLACNNLKVFASRRRPRARKCVRIHVCVLCKFMLGLPDHLRSFVVYGCTDM